MLTKIVMLLVLAATMLLQGCSKAPPDEKIGNIVRILMHEPGHYTVLTQESPTSAIIERSAPRGTLTEATYLSDVPEDQPMWLSSHSELIGIAGIRTYVVFHIHSVQDINGAGWRNSGKFGSSGQTNVVR